MDCFEATRFHCFSFVINLAILSETNWWLRLLVVTYFILTTENLSGISGNTILCVTSLPKVLRTTSEPQIPDLESYATDTLGT